jgi:hypothetical protein
VIKVKRINEFLGCNACKRGALKPDGMGIDLPYKFAFEVSAETKQGGVTMRLCPHCLVEFIAAAAQEVTANHDEWPAVDDYKEANR